MKRFAIIVGACLEAIALQFATFIPALVAFRIVAGRIYHAAPVWFPGYAIALGMSAMLWLWTFVRADEPLFRTVGAVLIGTALWFFFYFAVFFVYLMFARRDMISSFNVLLLLGSTVAVFYLRRVLVRRNTQAEHFTRQIHKV